MDKAGRELERVQDILNKMMRRAHNKRIGFEPKCKICTSKLVNEIEKKKREGATLKELQTYIMDESHEEVSLMSLSRHFNIHYQQKLKYIDEERLKEEKELQEGEKEIKKTLKYHPELEADLNFEYTLDNYDKPTYNDEGICTGFETYMRTGWEIFILDKGYCYTRQQFCDNIPKKQIYMSDEAISKIDTEIIRIEERSNDPFGEKRIHLLNKKFKCLQCSLWPKEMVLDGLLYLVTKKIVGTPMEMDKFYKLLSKDCDCDPQFLEEELEKYM